VAEISKFKVIALDGPPGVGKTALARAVASYRNARLILDEIGDNPFLVKFLVNRRQYALHAQVSSLLSRYRQQAEIAQPDLFHRMTVVNYTFAKEDIYSQVSLRAEEYHLYLHLRSALATKIVKPDVVIFLHARVDSLAERLSKRDGPARPAMDRDLLETVVDAYNTRFFQFDESPLLLVDVGDIDLTKTPVRMEPLFLELANLGPGRRHHTLVPA
jgi:deoxyadenosine/deoxycytidine kinase